MGSVSGKAGWFIKKGYQGETFRFDNSVVVHQQVSHNS
jgi:hypothetical protein